MSLERDAYSMLLPALDEFVVPDWLADALRRGTRSMLIGETRAEYVARRMSPERRSRESAQDFTALTAAARAAAGADLLVALDHEPWGTRRLHDLVPEIPVVRTDASAAELEHRALEVAAAARRMGVTLFLSPVLDRLTGPNPWLQGRTLDADPETISALATAFIAGARRGGVLTTAKHFPGFPTVTADPAEEDGYVPADSWYPSALIPFQAAVKAGVPAVMLGPARLQDVDPVQPASTSRIAVTLLREALGFTGVIVSDDLDAPATTRGRTVPQTAVAAVRAGVDLLLLAGGDSIDDVVSALLAEAGEDSSFARRIQTSGHRVRALADTLSGAAAAPE